MIRLLLLISGLCLSSVMSVSFYSSLGSGIAASVTLGVFGLLFEGAKAYAWDRVGRGSRLYLLLAIPASLVSLIAAMGFASLVLERGWSGAELGLARTEAQAHRLEALEAEERELIAAIGDLPAGWVSGSLRLGKRLDEVRIAMKAYQDPAVTLPSEQPIAATALALGKRFGLDVAWVVTGLLFLVATLLEVATVVFMLDRGTIQSVQVVSKVEPREERFLQDAVGQDGKLLGRRRLLELGWSEREQRDIVGRLREKGLLVSSGRGSPPRIAETTAAGR